MFKLISLCAGVLLISSVSLALSDRMILQESDKLKIALKQERKLEEKLKLLENFKDAVFIRINTINVPTQQNPVDLEAEKSAEAFRSLNEFETYLDLIVLKTATPKECSNIRGKIEASASREGTPVPESEEALKILQALCAN